MEKPLKEQYPLAFLHLHSFLKDSKINIEFLQLVIWMISGGRSKVNLFLVPILERGSFIYFDVDLTKIKPIHIF
jgi:hypothetical protein